MTLDLEIAFLALAVAFAGVAAVRLAPLVDPAIPLSAGLVLSVLSGNWDHIGIPIGLDRPLLLYGILAVALATRPGAVPERRIELTWVHWLLVVVALYGVGSALFTGMLLTSEPLFALLDRLGIVGFLLFAIAPVAFASTQRRDALLAALMALGAYLGLTALLETLDVRGLVFPRYINDPSVGITYGRARGPFVESGANGLAMYACMVATCVGWVRWPRPAVRALCVLVALACFVGILATVTRQVWIGAVAGSLVAMLSSSDLRRYVIPAAAVGLVCVTLSFAAIPGLRDTAASRAESQSSLWDRRNSNRAAIAMVDARPLLGFGWYSYGAVSGPYHQQAAGYPLTTVPRPHNVFLGNAAELGLVGTALWALSLLAAIGLAVGRRAPPELEPWRVGLIAIAVSWFVVANLSPLSYAFPNHLLWLWTGVVWVTGPAPKTRTDDG